MSIFVTVGLFFMQIGLHNQILASVNGGSDDEAVSKQNMDSEDDENNSFGSNIQIHEISQMLNLQNEVWKWQWWQGAAAQNNPLQVPADS